MAMKEKIQYFGYALVGIAKPWEKNPNIFAQTTFGDNYYLHVYVAPEGKFEWNLDTYYTKVYCKYSLTEFGKPTVKEKRKTFTSKEEFESFIMEVRSIKELYHL